MLELPANRGVIFDWVVSCSLMWMLDGNVKIRTLEEELGGWLCGGVVVFAASTIRFHAAQVTYTFVLLADYLFSRIAFEVDVKI